MERFRNSTFVQISLSLKKIFLKKKVTERFFFNLPTVKIWGQSDKFPISFSSLQRPLQGEKLIRENSAKYVNQTVNFYFRPK